MAIKWTPKDAVQSLHDLTSPFEKEGIGTPAQKPKLSDVLNGLRVKGTATPQQEL